MKKIRLLVSRNKREGWYYKFSQGKHWRINRCHSLRIKKLDFLPLDELDCFDCESCNGRGWFDERIGGECFSNPRATCPDCDGAGYWYKEKV